MISTLEKEITFRYLKTRKKDGFLNVISIFSFIGISLGVAVLIIVMSVMNGFRNELIDKIVGFNAHVTVDPYEKQIDSSKLSNENLKLISEDLIFSSSGEAVLLVNSSDEANEDIDESDTVQQIKKLLETRVRPAVAMDGGDIQFESFEDGIVTLLMKGACSGCPSSTATLKMGIENLLKHYIPEVTEVRPVA